MGDRGFNAGGYAYMPLVTCPRCGARRKLGRQGRDLGNLPCPNRAKCDARREKGHLLHRLNIEGES